MVNTTSDSLPTQRVEQSVPCDEIRLECPDAETKYVSDLLHRCMIVAAQKFLHPIPVLVDVKVSPSWGE